MAATVRYRAANPPDDITELRLLVELSSVRTLADRGLSDPELALVNSLAHATMRAARRADAAAYLLADMDYHLCLLKLTGNPALSDIARLMVVEPGRASRAQLSGPVMRREARDHRELAGLLGDGMVSAADHLLRTHLSRLPAGGPAPARFHGPDSIRCPGA